ncbi:HD domain-containing protein [bacterium]|nr:HD domain-containing protein [bacterium]
MTEKVFKNIRRNLPDGYSEDDLEYDRKKLRIAALLHDIGHYPLSHTLESAYQKYTYYETKYPKNGILKQENALTLTKKDLHHEYIGKHIIENCTNIKSILKKEFSEQDIEDISNTIIGDLIHERPFYAHILHSDLDVDTLDYCLRDSDGTGIAYGKYDINYLLDNVVLHSINDKFVICFKEKAIHTIEHFLLAKHFYYLQILYHPKRLFFEETATRFAIEAIKIGWLPSPKSYRDKIIEIEGTFYNDNYFWDLCSKAYKNKTIKDNKPTPAMHIYSRILFERLAPKNCLKIEKMKEINETDRDPNNIWKKLKESVLEKRVIEREFTFLDYKFKFDKITNDTFGRFYNYFNITKTTQEYRNSLEKRQSKVQNNEFLIQSRDSIKIIDEKGNIDFLSNNKDSLAYILAKNKIGIYLDFGD